VLANASVYRTLHSAEAPPAPVALAAVEGALISWTREVVASVEGETRRFSRLEASLESLQEKFSTMSASLEATEEKLTGVSTRLDVLTKERQRIIVRQCATAAEMRLLAVYSHRAESELGSLRIYGFQDADRWLCTMVAKTDHHESLSPQQRGMLKALPVGLRTARLIAGETASDDSLSKVRSSAYLGAHPDVWSLGDEDLESCIEGFPAATDGATMGRAASAHDARAVVALFLIVRRTSTSTA
jgi:hypothetical protein